MSCLKRPPRVLLIFASAFRALLRRSSRPVLTSPDGVMINPRYLYSRTHSNCELLYVNLWFLRSLIKNHAIWIHLCRKSTKRVMLMCSIWDGVYGPGFRFHFLYSFYVYVGLIMKSFVGFREILGGFDEEEYLMKKSCWPRLLDPVPSN